MALISQYLLVLLLTIAIELFVAFLFEYRKKKEIISIVFINAITNPILNYLLLVNHHFSIIKSQQLLIIFLEILVVIVEWRILVYALNQKNKKLFVLSLAMNSCSYLIGILIFN